MNKLLILFFSLALLLSTSVFAQSTNGSLTGTIVDSESGETLIGVNVVLEGTVKGTASDIDGNYTIKSIEPGTYTLVVSYISFTPQKITGIEIVAGETVQLDIILQPETEFLDEIVVTAEAVLDNEAGLLKQRQKSISFSDAISAESIARSGAGDAAGAMKKVVGASVVGGKYVYVRGLGDRYSSSHLNGVELPSADPDKKSFQFDIFPSSLLENIITIKTFTPDKPGNFSGGLVDVYTKDFPEQRTFSVSFSGGYNALASGKEGYLSTTGSTDYLAKDDGTRAVPQPILDYISDPEFDLPSSSSARFISEDAYLLDDFSSHFNNEMAPKITTLPYNFGGSIAYGDQLELLGNPLGYTMSLTYNQSASNYSDGKLGRWQLIGELDKSGGLTNLFDLTDQKSTISVDMGLLAGVSYKIGEGHKVSTNLITTRSGQHGARNINGVWNEEAPDRGYQSSVIQYIERSLTALQFSGKHYFKGLLNSTIDWKYSVATNTQSEPDLRFLTYLIGEDEDGQTFLSLSSGLFQRPARFFRELEEDSDNLILDYSVPFEFLGNSGGKFKTGYYQQSINRDFAENRFEYEIGARSFSDFANDINGFFSYTGIVDSSQIGTRTRYTFGNLIDDDTNQKNQYTAEKEITAFYLMVELPITSQLKLITGFRPEMTKMNTTSGDTSTAPGILDNTDILPAVSAVYNLTDNMNIRGSYTNTIARPTFRELAPYTTFDFVGDFIFTGNAELERTLITNMDLRWEWFPNAGEIIAVSVFYKDIENPIERIVRLDVNRAQSVQNVAEAQVYGMEFEIRKSLNFISEALSNFQFSNNFSLVQSEVSIPDAELFNIRINDPDAPDTRSLAGQSPFLLNFDLEYFKEDNGFSANASFNRFGDRLYSVALGAIPDVFERGYSTLDIIVNKSFSNGFKAKLSAKNLFDPAVKLSHELEGQEYIYQSYKTGRSISLSLSYSF
ncbi:MAG: TonB-dependent receptor [Bacteroidetes bacterium]|nr:TonB-dependent receptor [Bacteroidota bacterium]MDA1126076.1 TonB-dependent receptor [Bacteroidota bacterium]